MDYLASEPVVREFSERTLFLPAHAGLVAAGDLQFQSEDPNVQPALEEFVQSSTETLPASTRCRPGAGPTPTTARS
jgi:alpha-1,4-digalacturonate transport system substrate-binding protein